MEVLSSAGLESTTRVFSCAQNGHFIWFTPSVLSSAGILPGTPVQLKYLSVLRAVLDGEAHTSHLILAKAYNLNFITDIKNIFNLVNSVIGNP